MNTPNNSPLEEKCFACDRPMKSFQPKMVWTCDGGQYVVVGNDCYRKIKKAGINGYQPPLGGPRLTTYEPPS